MPYYKGISSRVYKDAELQEMANEKIIYNNKEITKYEAMQEQRKIERVIRQDKKDIASLNGILLSNTKDTKLLEKTKMEIYNKKLDYYLHKKQLNSFLEQTEFRKDNSRLLIN